MMNEKSFVLKYREKLTEFVKHKSKMTDQNKALTSLVNNFNNLTVKYIKVLEEKKDSIGAFPVDMVHSIVENYFMSFLILFDLCVQNQNGKLHQPYQVKNAKDWIHPSKKNEFSAILPDPEAHIPKLTIASYDGFRFMRTQLFTEIKVDIKVINH